MVNIEGNNYSYDYSELIEELEQDLKEGLIKSSTIIGIVRSSDSLDKGIEYYPIVDYYYPHAFKDDSPQDIYNRDEYTDEEWDAMNREYQAAYEQFKKDKNNIQGMSVLATLTEMKKWNSIID